MTSKNCYLILIIQFNIRCLNIYSFIGCLDIHGYIVCLNILGTHVTANNAVFIFVSDLKIVYYNNY